MRRHQAARMAVLAALAVALTAVFSAVAPARAALSLEEVRDYANGGEVGTYVIPGEARSEEELKDAFLINEPLIFYGVYDEGLKARAGWSSPIYQGKQIAYIAYMDIGSDGKACMTFPREEISTKSKLVCEKMAGYFEKYRPEAAALINAPATTLYIYTREYGLFVLDDQIYHIEPPEPLLPISSIDPSILPTLPLTPIVTGEYFTVRHISARIERTGPRLSVISNVKLFDESCPRRVCVELQRQTGEEWETVERWVDYTGGEVSREVSAESGRYRVRVTAQVYDETLGFVEAASETSLEAGGAEPSLSVAYSTLTCEAGLSLFSSADSAYVVTELQRLDGAAWNTVKKSAFYASSTKREVARNVGNGTFRLKATVYYYGAGHESLGSSVSYSAEAEF